MIQEQEEDEELGSVMVNSAGRKPERPLWTQGRDQDSVSYSSASDCFESSGSHEESAQSMVNG